MRNSPWAAKAIYFFLAFWIIILWIMIPGFLYAGGSKEPGSAEKLKEAEKLIAEKDYNQAILLLGEIARTDPEAFEAAENMIRKIREIWGEYNRKYETLIEVLFEERDLGRALELIRELQELNPRPNEAAVKALAKAKEGAELVYYLNLFNEIMDKALAQLEEQSFTGAVQTYLSGYSLLKVPFDEAGYGNIIKNSVEESLKSMQEASVEFNTTALALSGITAEDAEALLNLPIEGLDRAPEILSVSEKVLAQKRTVKEAVSNFKDLNKQIKNTGEEGKFDLFLHFAGQLAAGRPSEETWEGILAAMDLSWSASFQSLDDSLSAAAEKYYTAGVEGFRGRDYESASEELGRAHNIYYSALNIKSQWQKQLAFAPGFKLEERSRLLVEKHLPEFLMIQEKLKAIGDYRTLIDTYQVLDKLLGGDRTSIDQVVSEQGRVVEIKRDMEGRKQTWEASIRRYGDISSLGFDLLRHVDQSRAMISEFDALISELASANIYFISTVVKLAVRQWESALEGWDKKYEEGLGFKRGIEVALEPVRDTEGRVVATPVRIEHYPDRALFIFEPLSEAFTQTIADIDDRLESVSEVEEYVLEDRDLREQITYAGNLRASVEERQKKLAERMQEARRDIFQAEKFKREGLLRVQEARNNLGREEFEQSGENIRNAQEAFDQSLSYKEDEEVRRIRDRELTALARLTVDSENDRVVSEVRRLINTGKRSYNQGDFTGAESALLKALARWADTNPDENKEITLWLGFTRSALTVNSGREISERDPLYTEMSQLYNLAKGDYLAGKELLEQGNVRDALEKLESAEDKLVNIMIPFPYNREARLLSLQIERLRDQEGFAERLTSYFSGAVKKADTSPQEAYIDLKDLEQIKPDYPGLKDSIYNLEIKLKIRIPPPDPARIAQSKDLYTQALSIVQRDLRDLYPVALEQLNKAIELDPENQRAVALKDRIQIAAGGTVQTVLTSDAERQYREAEQNYLAGNYFEALAIVEDLLRDKRNQGYPPLLELRERIKARI